MGDEHTAPEYGAWTQQIPREVLTEDFAGFKTIGDFAKHHIEMKTEHTKTQGRLKEAIFRPGKDAGEAEKAAYRKALGVPDSKDAYKIEGKDISPERIASIKEFAFSHNLDNDQAAALFEREEKEKAEFLSTMKSKREEKRKAAENFLSNEYKDKAKEKVERAYRLVEKLGGEDLKKELDATGLGDSINLIKFMVKVSESFGEDGMPLGERSGGDEGGVDLAKMYPKSNHPKRK